MNTRNYLAMLIVIAAFQVDASAQQATTVSATAKVDSTAMLRKFSSIKGTPEAKNTLEIIHSQALQPTADNINLLSQALAGKLTAEERVLVIGILGHLHSRNDPVGLNAKIRSEVKGQIYSGDPDAARAATFALSRIGYDDDMMEGLTYARTENLISKDEYAGEIARNVRFAPEVKQRELILSWNWKAAAMVLRY